MSAVLVLALVEEVGLRRPGPVSKFVLVAIVVAALLCGAALHRYVRMLRRAASLAEQCVCPQCRSYGVVRVIAAGAAAGDEDPQWMRMACQKCSHEWRIESP